MRLLVAVPLLILAEWLVHRRLRPVIDQFTVRGLVRPAQMSRFEEATRESLGLRNSVVAELLMIAFVYAVGILVVWRLYVALHTDSWYASETPHGRRLSLAGAWFVFVSLPIFQFLLVRWYFRLVIWARFLWRVARLDLDLDAIHPDRAAGLGFLGECLYAFVPIAMAHGAIFAGMIANRIFYGGSRLVDFEVEVFAGVAALLLVFVAPLLIFAPLLARVRRRGLLKYGALAQVYARTFADKWLGGGAPAGEPLIGSSDIQSLADLANSFSVVDQMRLAPISRAPLLWFAAAILAPIAPLALTMTSVEKLIGRLVGLVL